MKEKLYKCSICEIEKPFLDYYTNKKGKLRGTKCKSCNNIDQYQIDA